jgi:heterodisulfide reductase subunit C
MDVMVLGADNGFAAEIYERTGQDARLCMQCGKCTGGCPMDFAYDFSVNQAMRMIRAGRREELLRSEAVWLCASCHTCSVRCPQNIEVFEVMEALRHLAREEGSVSLRRFRLFADAFLDSVARYGRVHELHLMLKYNLLSGRPLTDAGLGPMALLKSKLHLRPKRIQGRDEVARIVQRYRRGAGE